jgi:hypothetical protein
VLKGLDLPNCLTYADAYRSAQSVFKRDGTRWREYLANGGPAVFEFKESGRNREFIELVNLTPRPGYDGPLVVHLPVCGGMAKMSVTDTLKLVDLAEFVPDRFITIKIGSEPKYP